MSTRSSPLSSPSPPPPPQTKPTDPFRSLSPLSSVSDISQSGVLPPSSPPLADVFIDQEVDEEIEEDGRDTRSQTSETVPLGSESDLTEEETDEDEGEEVVVVDGPPVGIRPSVVPESTEEDGDMEVDDEPTPHHTRPKRIVSATTSASPTRTRSTSGLITRQASKSPSLTPPPPSEKTRLRALPRLSASPGVKRKRSSPPVPPGEVVKAQSPLEAASTGFGGDLLPAQNANHLELNGQDVGLTDEVTAESYEDKDISVDDPEADQAFKEAMDSFDNEHEEPDIVNGDPVERVVDDDEEMREDVGGEQQDDPLDVEEAVGDAVGPLMGLEQEEEVTDSADQAQEGVMPTKMEENGAVEETDTAAPADAPDEAIIEQEEPAPSPKATLHPPAPHSHSSHAPPPTQAAMRALLALEVKFAALRDRLYIERMEEAAEEEEMILNGSHPALKQLHKTLSHRRERLHELASRRHAQAVQQLKVVRQAEQDAVWSWWTDERDRTHWEEFEQTWSKRRRLAREKNEIESVRWTKPVPIAGDPRFGKSFDWAAGPSPARLTVDEGNHDLALIEHRQQISRHASPAVFPPLSSYPIPQHPGQYPSYPPVGHNQTYAEAVSEPRPRQSSSSHYHSRQTQPQQPPPYTGTGLMDHYAYPRNATAIGPSTSSSSLGLSQPSSQPRREGRTVPTASTMFGPGPGSGTTPNHGHNSSIANAQFPTLTSAVPVPSAQNGIGKEVKQESLDYLNRDKTGTPATATAAPTPTGYGNIGPWGNRSVPMGFGLGFGLGGGGSGSSTAGFGTLGSTQSQGNTAGTGNGLGQGRKEGSLVNGGGTSNGYQPPWATQSSTTIGKYGQADRLAETASSTSTPAQTPTPTPTGRPPTPSQAQQQRPNPSPNPSATNQFSRVSANSSGNGSTGGITTLNGVLADKEREKEREKEKEKEKEKERERDWSRPKYPGLAEYLDATAALAAAAADGHGRANTAGGVTGTGAAQGAQTGTAAAGTVGGGGGGGVGAVSGTGYGGLGRLGIMGSSTNGVLSPPRISRSPFGPPPPQATTTSAPAQTASRT